MPERSVRFVHSSDWHLERPLSGIPQIPEEWHNLLLDSPYLAAEKIFDLVIAERADFLVLSGDIVDLDRAGPRAIRFLSSNFDRLRQKGIHVYWLGGQVDPIEKWPASLPLPENVHRLSLTRADSRFWPNEDRPSVEILPIGRTRATMSSLEAIADGVERYVIAVAFQPGDLSLLPTRGVDYFALGGSHHRETSSLGGAHVHSPGSPQGRNPEEVSNHGCTVVDVDASGRSQLRFIPTDIVEFHTLHLSLDPTVDRAMFEHRLREKTRELLEAENCSDVLIVWRIDGAGSLLGSLGNERLREEILGELRREFSAARPRAWTIDLRVAPTPISNAWFEEETIRGDFLRALRPWMDGTGQPMPDVATLLSSSAYTEGMRELVRLTDVSERNRVLLDAAHLGAELLTGRDH